MPDHPANPLECGRVRGLDGRCDAALPLRFAIEFLPAITMLTYFGGGVASLIATDRLMRRGRRVTPLCVHCGYDLSSTPRAGPCPECGRPHQIKERVRPLIVRVLDTGMCVWPFAIAPVGILVFATYSQMRAGENLAIAAAVLTLIPYAMIHAIAMNIARPSRFRDTRILAMSGALAAGVPHAVLFWHGFIIEPDPFMILVAFGSLAYLFPPCGIGFLLAAVFVTRTARREERRTRPISKERPSAPPTPPHTPQSSP